MNKSISFAPLLEQFNNEEERGESALTGVEFYALKYLDFQLTDNDLHDSTSTIHHHTLFELHLVKRGQNEYVVNGNRLLLNKGDFLLIPPSVEHGAMRRSENLQKFGLLFRFPSESSCCSAVLLDRVQESYLVGKALPIMTNTLEFMFKNISVQDDDSVILLRNAMEIFMRAFFSLLKKNFEAEGDEKKQYQAKLRNSPELCELVAGYIKENLSSLSLEKVAKHFYISSRQLNRRLNAYFGMSYCQLVDKLRMDCSRNLLCYSDLSIEAIAYHVGASNTSNFIRFFKRMEGISPSQYRKDFHRFSEEGQKKGGGS